MTFVSTSSGDKVNVKPLSPKRESLEEITPNLSSSNRCHFHCKYTLDPNTDLSVVKSVILCEPWYITTDNTVATVSFLNTVPLDDSILKLVVI